MARLLPVLLAAACACPAGAAAAEAPAGRMGFGRVLIGRADRKAPAVWSVHLRKGDRVVVEVSSSGPVSVAVAGPGGTPGDPVARGATKGGKAAPARVEVTARVAGEYDVAVSADRDRAEYRLRLRCEAGTCMEPRASTCGPTDPAWGRSTPALLLQAPERWTGRRVKLHRRIAVGPGTCTARACPAEGCCNACTASMVFARGPEVAAPVADAGDLVLDGLGCAGTECTLADSCPYAPGDWVSVWGRFETDGGRPVLHVEGACGPERGAKAPAPPDDGGE